MKRVLMRKIVLACFIIVGGIVGVVVYLNSKPSAIQLPDADTILEIQLDAIKIDSSRFDREKLDDIMTNIESAIPESRLNALQFPQKDEYYVIAFLDENQQRQSFYFYCVDEQYYMQTESGDVYTNVEFIEEYLVGYFGWIPAPRGVVVGISVPEEISVTYAMDTNYDVRYWLYNEILLNIVEGMSEEEAISDAKDSILLEYRLYQYAIQNKYDIPEELYEQLVESRILDAKEQDNYADVEQVYETAGTTIEQHIVKSSELIWRAEDTIDYMKYCFYNEFRHGNYVYDGVEFDSAGAYRDAKVNDLLLYVIDDIDVSGFEKKLTEAEEYYRQYISLANLIG